MKTGLVPPKGSDWDRIRCPKMIERGEARGLGADLGNALVHLAWKTAADGSGEERQQTRDVISRIRANVSLQISTLNWPTHSPQHVNATLNTYEGYTASAITFS
jgi:hypothetical protein